jgi:hypothetical protein
MNSRTDFMDRRETELLAWLVDLHDADTSLAQLQLNNLLSLASAGSSSTIRVWALRNLNRLCLPADSLPHITMTLNDSDDLVRISACELLWRFPSQRPQVEECVIDLLYTISSEQSFKLLMGTIRNGPMKTLLIMQAIRIRMEQLSNNPVLLLYILYNLMQLGVPHQLSQIPHLSQLPDDVLYRFMHEQLVRAAVPG